MIKNKYKLIAIDIDGTLLDSNHQIPMKNIKVINQLYKEGVSFVIATGRPDIFVGDIVEKLGINSIVIGSNGASVRNIKTKEEVFVNYIDTDILGTLIRIFYEKDIEFLAFSIDTMFANKHNEEVFNDFIVDRNGASTDDRMDYVLTQNMNIITENKIIKIVLMGKDPYDTLKIRDEIKSFPGIENYLSEPCCLDIVRQGTSKATALEVISKKLNINRDEIIAIGDSENDKEMLKFSGVSVAMGNATDSIKNFADMTTKTNDEAGVSVALMKLFGKVLD